MPWVYFTGDFDWQAKRNVIIAYKAGHKYLVKQVCHDEAVKSGKGMSMPSRKANEDASR